MKETYLVDLISITTKQITRNKNIKQWSDFEKKIITDNRDNRTSKEIEEDVLNKFKNLKGRG